MIACPAKPGTRYGNRITALRWQAILRGLGHSTRISESYDGDADVLIALHARRSAPVITQAKQLHADRPVILAITGTDLYRDGDTTATQTSLRLADRIVILHPLAKQELPRRCRSKAHVIYQSVNALSIARPQQPRVHRVLVAGHLRPVKDPFRVAMAVRSLPSDSRIQVHHYGSIIDATMRQRATTESTSNDRYQWHGEIPRGELKRRLATCWMMVLSSKLEGGANVLSESIVHGTPVLASRIPGNVGLLGEDYEGYFDVGDTRQLRARLMEAETDTDFYARLQSQVKSQAHLFRREHEIASWRKLLNSLES